MAEVLVRQIEYATCQALAGGDDEDAELSAAVLGHLARRACAALGWNPIVGDRVQHLVFTGPDRDRDRIHALLDACLLTLPEALAGSPAWRHYDDPFAPRRGAEAAVPR